MGIITDLFMPFLMLLILLRKTMLEPCSGISSSSRMPELELNHGSEADDPATLSPPASLLRDENGELVAPRPRPFIGPEIEIVF